MQPGSCETEAVQKENSKKKDTIKRLEKQPTGEEEARLYVIRLNLKKFRCEDPLQTHLEKLLTSFAKRRSASRGGSCDWSANTSQY